MNSKAQRPRRSMLLLVVFAMGVATIPQLSQAAGGEDKATDFVYKIYRNYELGKSIRLDSENTIHLFSYKLAQLIQHDKETARGEAGKLDYDPFCNCQDFDALAQVRVTRASRRAGRSNITVSFANGAHLEKLTYVLVREENHWKIDDICSSLHKCVKKSLSIPNKTH